jgi:hypothetical protein
VLFVSALLEKGQKKVNRATQPVRLDKVRLSNVKSSSIRGCRLGT